METCPICGKAFEKKKRQKFCSLACKREHDHAVLHEKRLANRKTCTCVVCGKEFFKTKGLQVTCSPECRKVHKLENCKRFNERNKQPPREAKCNACGKVFPVIGHFYRYCEECRAKGFGSAGRGGTPGTDDFGLSLETRRLIAFQQDYLSPEDLFKASQSWTDKQRRYAKARYEHKHGLFTIYI